MGEAYFYHLTDGTPETTVPMLIARSRAAGWRVELRGVAADRMGRLDALLWQQGPAEGFVPHGLATGGPQDALQPVLLTVAPGGGVAIDCLITIDGAGVTPQEVIAAARTCILFDGQDPAAVEGARGQWRALTGAGCAARYWAQEDGRWLQKAQSGGGS